MDSHVSAKNLPGTKKALTLFGRKISEKERPFSAENKKLKIYI